MKQKISSRILIVLLTVVMLITALPLNSLTAFADEYTGSGSGSATVAGVDNSKLNMSGTEYGVRIYCITKDKAIKAGTTYSAVDLWYDTGCIQGTYSTSCRFGSVPAAKIYADTFGSGVSVANTELKTKGVLTGTNKISNIPEFAGFAGSDFYMSGVDFRQWATGSVKTNEGDTWNVVTLYYGITGITIDKGDFLVIEPLMCLPVVKGTYPNGMWYDGHYAGTWYGYMQKLGNNSGGTMMNIKAAWGNGFKLDKAKAGLSKAGRYTRSTYHSAIGSTGWGLHVLETTDSFGDNTDPIDSYDILTKPGSPDHCEPPKNETKKTPKYDNTGTRTIVKTYVDLYKDKNNSGHYTAAIDSGTFIVDDCSEKVVISNEFYRTGYSVKAWYTSKSLPSADEENYKGTSMLHKSSSTTSGVGDQSYTIEGYMQMSGITANGSKSYKMQKIEVKDGKSEYKNLGTNINKNYTRTNAIPKTGSISRIGDASTSQYIKLSDTDSTIVILYVREHGYIDSSTFTETSINNDPHQELKIVKCYGIVNPATYEVENDKDTVYTTSKTRNVNVRDEKGYRFAEFVYCTRGNSSYSSMTASKWCQVKGDEKSKNNQFYVKGFIDGFSASPFGSGTYSSQYAWGIYKPADMDTMHGERDRTDSAEYAGGAIASTGTYKGTKGRGRLSGDILDGYNKTIYFGGVSMQDTTNTNTSDDVLYLLFLKDDEVEYEVGDFGIPESYITRRNNFATNNVKVGGVTGSSSKQYSFAAHQFKYSLIYILTHSVKGKSIKALIFLLLFKKAGNIQRHQAS